MKKINLAIQKSGRLNKESILLLEKAGIKFDNFKDQLKVDCQNFPLNIYFLRNSDIPRYLSDGVVDIAIIGQNLIQESELNIDEIMNLNFSRCRVSIAIPLNMKYSGLKDLNNLKIATSYPNTLKKFLSNNNLNCEIHKINGFIKLQFLSKMWIFMDFMQFFFLKMALKFFLRTFSIHYGYSKGPPGHRL